MGKYQFVVSIDESYKTLTKDIMLADRIYENKRTGEPNYKKICEDGVRLIHLLKNGAIQYVLVGVQNKSALKKEFEMIKKILGGKEYDIAKDY